MLLMGTAPGQLSFPLNMSQGVPANLDLFLAGFVGHFGKNRRAGDAVRPAKTTVPRGVGDARARIEEAYEILEDWPVQFIARVDELLSEPARMSTVSVARRLGPWYGFLFRQFTDGAYEQIRQAAANRIVATHDGRVDARTQNLTALATVSKDWLTIAEAARELRVRPDRLATGVDDGRIAASVDRKAAGYTQRFLSRSEVERLRAVQAAHVDESAAAKNLGLPESVLRLMKEAGLVNASDPTVTPPVTKGLVLVQSLESLRARLRFDQLPIADQTADRYIALRDLNLRRTTDRQRMIRLLRELFSGGIVDIARDGSGRLGGVLLLETEVQDRIASQAPDMALTVQQISQVTSSHFDAIRAWIDSGLLPAKQRTDRQGRPWLVQLDDLIRFLMTYAPLATLAAATGSSSRGLTARLTESGVEVVGAGSSRGSLVRIIDCVVASTAERTAESSAHRTGTTGEASGQ